MLGHHFCADVEERFRTPGLPDGDDARLGAVTGGPLGVVGADLGAVAEAVGATRPARQADPLGGPGPEGTARVHVAHADDALL